MLLGLDLGTTNVKALVTDHAGRCLARATSPIQLQYVGEGGVEQDIQEIETATRAVLRQIAGSISPSEIEAIGVSSQGGAMQVTDALGQPLGRVISWLDQRGRPFDDALTAELGQKWLVQHVGRGRAGLGIGQVLRLRRETPELLRRPNRVSFVGDVIVSRLCGRAAQDGTSGSLTVLYNPSLRTYDPDLLQRLGLDPRQLPDLIAASEVAGELKAAFAQETGLRQGIPVSAAVHDQYASALGCGAVHAGTVMLGSGTAWVLLSVNDRLTTPVNDQAFVCGHVIEGLWGQILSMVNGGSSFSWAIHVLGLGKTDSGEVEAMLESTRPGAAGLTFWPFLTSAGPDGCAPGTRGRLSGLQLSHRPADILRAVLEGLAFELNRHLGFLLTAGWPAARLVMGGAAASSRVTTQILADVTGLPLDCHGAGEASLLGAVILARKLLEPKSSFSALAAEMAPSARRVEPSTDAAFYRKAFEGYLHSLPQERTP